MTSTSTQSQDDSAFPIPVDSFYITEACIPNVAVLVSRVACLCLRNSCYYYTKLSPKTNPFTLCCKSCLNSSLLKLTNTLFSQHLKTSGLTPLAALQPTKDFTQSLLDGSYELDMQKTLGQMLSVLRASFRIRMTELVQTVALFDRILKQHWACFPFFYLFRGSLKTMFLSTVVVAHKSNTDMNIRNESFATTFHLPKSTLNHFELSVLELLEYSTLVSPQSYATFGPVLFGPNEWSANQAAIQQECDECAIVPSDPILPGCSQTSEAAEEPVSSSSYPGSSSAASATFIQTDPTQAPSDSSEEAPTSSSQTGITTYIQPAPSQWSYV